MFNFQIDFHCTKCKYNSKQSCYHNEITITIPTSQSIDKFSVETLIYRQLIYNNAIIAYENKCQNCKSKYLQITGKIKKQPQTILVRLCRFSGSKLKHNDSIKIIPIFIFGRYSYELNGILSHIGDNFQDGKYIFERKQKDGNWVCYDKNRMYFLKDLDPEFDPVKCRDRDACTLLYTKCAT